jgi:fructokinase
MRIGIDLGGTKIEAAVLARDGALVARHRTTTPRDDYEATLSVMAALVRRCEEDAGEPCTVGVGMPGSLSRVTGLVKNANSTWLNGRPLLDDLERTLARTVRLANDADCFALSEASDGAAAGARIVFGVIVGTGTGGGVVVDGRLVCGPSGISGEWGHNPLPWPRKSEWPGPACYCGKQGCIETWLSGPGLARDHEARVGQALDAAAIAEGAERGDPACTSTIASYCDRMARALATVLNVLDPDVIVLGGGMSNVRALYEQVPRLWGGYAFTDRVETHLVAPRFGDSSGVRGAAWLWPPGEA